MSPRPHEGPAEGGLSSSLLQIVHDGERVDHLRAVLSGFCHRCRNSLNGIKMSLYLFRRESRGAVPDCWDQIESVYHQVESLFDHLQTIYRPMSLAMVRSPLDALIQQHLPKWRSWYESRGRCLRIDPPCTEVPGEFDPAQIGVGLDALAAWRAEVCPPGALTRVAWVVNDGSIQLRWHEVTGAHPDDPPQHAGIANGRDGARSSRPVDALALPLLARIVAAHGGRLEFEPGPGFGVLLRWPQSQRAGRGGD